MIPITASRVRLVLKAFAVARYLGSNQRLTVFLLFGPNFQKISTNVKLFVKGHKTAKEIVKTAIPFYQRSLSILTDVIVISGDQFNIAREKGRIKFYLVSMVLIGIGSYEYYHYCNIVPITHRRHFAVVVWRSFEE